MVKRSHCSSLPSSCHDLAGGGGGLTLQEAATVQVMGRHTRWKWQRGSAGAKDGGGGASKEVTRFSRKPALADTTIIYVSSKSG